MANSEWRIANKSVSMRHPLFAIRALCPPSRRRGKRIVGPGMLRVAAAHFRAHGGVAAAPEARQIARHLHRPVRRREEFDQQRDFAAGNRRMAVETEQLLDADRYLRPPVRIVIDRNARAGRSREMGGRLGVKAALQGIGQARLEYGFKFVGGKLGQRGLAVKERRKPVDIGGYYHADAELISKAMRPSATFNAAVAALV